jgi:hypothetical protein
LPPVVIDMGTAPRTVVRGAVLLFRLDERKSGVRGRTMDRLQ